MDWHIVMRLRTICCVGLALCSMGLASFSSLPTIVPELGRRHALPVQLEGARGLWFKELLGRMWEYWL